MSDKSKIIVIIILLLIVSQWALVKLVYAKRLDNGFSYWLAKTYHLSVAKVEDSKRVYKIALADYLDHRDFLDKNFSQESLDSSESDLNELAWQRTLKDYWLKHFAADHKLEATDSEIDEYMASMVGVDLSFAEFTQKNYNLSLEKFKNLFIVPYILENKVYTYLLNNYNDSEGIRQAQNAYEALEAGRDFAAVAQEFSTDDSYTDSSVWLKQEDLVDYYEPIADLQPGEFSRIVMIPGGYIIWQVQAITSDESGKAWQVGSLFIKALSLEDFFQDYVKRAKINKKI